MSGRRFPSVSFSPLRGAARALSPRPPSRMPFAGPRSEAYPVPVLAAPWPRSGAPRCPPARDRVDPTFLGGWAFDASDGSPPSTLTSFSLPICSRFRRHLPGPFLLWRVCLPTQVEPRHPELGVKAKKQSARAGPPFSPPRATFYGSSPDGSASLGDTSIRTTVVAVAVPTSRESCCLELPCLIEVGDCALAPWGI